MATEKFYLGFSPSLGKSDSVDALIAHWDQAMDELKTTKAIVEILEEYGLEDWSKAQP